MRIAGMESVVKLKDGMFAVDLRDEQWTLASREERWYAMGERLCREFLEIEEGLWVDRLGNLYSCPMGLSDAAAVR